MEYLLSLKDANSLVDTDQSGLTPLYVACYNIKRQMVDYLLTRPDCDIFKSRGPCEATVFHAVVDRDSIEICQVLI